MYRILSIIGALWVSILIPACSSENVEIPVETESSGDSSVTEVSSLSATLYRPSEEGPAAAAVVLMHGCAGVLNKHKDWAEKLADWGYYALVVDSFTPRGVGRICESGNRVWARFDRLRPQDAEAALKYLRSLPEVIPDRIGLMGWSYGGTTTLSLMEESQRPQAVDFSAAVAVYPSCWQFLQRFTTREYFASQPLMIAMGAEDDWTRPEHCEQLLSQVASNSAPVSVNLYAGAYHDFDNSRQPLINLQGVRVEDDSEYGDVTVGYNRAAHQAVLSDVQEFLGKNL